MSKKKAIKVPLEKWKTFEKFIVRKDDLEQATTEVHEFLAEQFINYDFEEDPLVMSVIKLIDLLGEVFYEKVNVNKSSKNGVRVASIIIEEIE